MTYKELKEKLEKLHVPDEAEIQIMTDKEEASIDEGQAKPRISLKEIDERLITIDDYI